MQWIEQVRYRTKRPRGRAIVVGWFSFTEGGTTAGDILACTKVCDWLRKAGYSYDVALCDQFLGGIRQDRVNPRDYSHFLFVCGPFSQDSLSESLLKRFAGCRRIGVNLSMLLPLKLWNPFDILLERDSSRRSRPDISFATHTPRVPVIGVIPVEPIPEYPDRAMHDEINRAIRKLISRRELSIIEIDTRLPGNLTGLRSPAEIESLVARMDVVLTTRLHGLVLALKNGVPAIAIDPHAGGSKVQQQAKAIGWPVVFNPEDLNDRALMEALNYCLSKEARRKACHCAQRAVAIVENEGKKFIASLLDLSTSRTGKRAC